MDFTNARMDISREIQGRNRLLTSDFFKIKSSEREQNIIPSGTDGKSVNFKQHWTYFFEKEGRAC